MIAKIPHRISARNLRDHGMTALGDLSAGGPPGERPAGVPASRRPQAAWTLEQFLQGPAADVLDQRYAGGIDRLTPVRP